ncbi:MAG: cytochrome P450 [Burkholderiales bacterium]
MNAVLREAVPPASAWPLDEAALRDPYPHFHAWREAGPLHWSPHLFGGAWVLTRHADCEAALRDERLSAQRTGGWVQRGGGRSLQNDDAASGSRGEPANQRAAFQRLFARALLFVDAPDHTRLRRLMQPAFTPAAVLRLRAGIAAECEALLSAAEATLKQQGVCDLIEAVARPLPARVIGRLLGLPAADGRQCMAWSDDLANFLGAAQPDAGQIDRAEAALVGMVRCFDDLLPARRTTPHDDLLGHLARHHEAGRFHGALGGRAELLAQCAMLLFAGHETTRHLLGSLLHHLLAEPGRWARLRQRHRTDPACLGAVVREALRHDSPVHYTGRRVTRDFTLHGQPLRRGDLVLVLIGAANRDPARYDRPDAFDPGRANSPSLAFGIGTHFCLGAQLTMLEAETLLGQMLHRWPEPTLHDLQGDWLASPLYRGLRSLWVKPVATLT